MEMKECADNYRNIFVGAVEPIIVTDESGHIVEVNPSACAFSGYTRDELLGERLETLDVTSCVDSHAVKFSDIVKASFTRNSVLLRHKNGAPIPTTITKSGVIWNTRRAICIFCRYLPDMERTETLLRENEARLRAITDSTKDAILMMDEKGLISFWNPAAEKIFGYTKTEAIGKNLHLLLAPVRYHRDHEMAFRIFQQTGKGDAIDSTLELEAQHRDGHEFSIELSLSRIEVLGAWHTIGIIRDITERKRSEEDLRESEERFRALHNASFGGIAIHDKGVILDCNQGLSAMTGFSIDELVGLDGLQLIVPDWRPIVMENILSGSQAEYEVQGLRKDGTVFPVSLRGSNIPYRGKTVRVTEFRDITKRKQAEEERKQLEIQLLQAQKMEAIGALAGGIAHDFNNILSAILGYVELSRNVIPETSPAVEYLGKALKGIRRATLLVSQILAFSRQSGAESILLDVPSVITETLKLLRPLLPTTISIHRQIEEGVWTIDANPTQVHQILMNLCTNAFHAMEGSGGVLTIALKNIELSGTDLQNHPGVTPGRFIMLTVGDNGPGIPEELLGRIFEPYFTTKSVGKGSGMGLAIIHGIVKNYGGFIVVDSGLETGTRFNVHLPAAEHGRHSKTVDHGTIIQGSERILLVDDEEIVSDMGRSILEHLGYKVTAFTDSLGALQAFSDDPSQFDVVITDQTMPVMTGIDLARRMLAIRQDIPVIICTGYSSSISEENARSFGIRGFAMKPLSIKQISVLIRKVLDEPENSQRVHPADSER